MLERAPIFMTLVLKLAVQCCCFTDNLAYSSSTRERANVPGADIVHLYVVRHVATWRVGIPDTGT